MSRVESGRPLPHAVSAQVHISSPVSGDTVCYKDQIEATCCYPAVTTPGKYLVQTPGWRVNGSLLTLDGTFVLEEILNVTASKLIVNVADTFSANTVVAYSCFLVLADTQLDESTEQVHVTIMG